MHTGLTHGTLIVDNNGRVVGNTPLNPTAFRSGTHVFDAIVITNNGVLAFLDDAQLDLTASPTVHTHNVNGSNRDCRIAFAGGSNIALPASYTLDWVLAQHGSDPLDLTIDLTIAAGGLLTHIPNAAAETHKLNLVLDGDLTIENGGAIDVWGCGYAPLQGDGKPVPTSSRGGGGHGGQGGKGYQSTARSATYGSVTNPVTSGSGANKYRGGGVAVLRVSGSVTNNGTIRADGESTPSQNLTAGGGAGGSVNLKAASLSGNGTVTAIGGSTHDNSGGGGGGRIAVVVTNTPGFGNVTFNATGGALSGNPSQYGQEHGAAGTIYLLDANAVHGMLIVTNHRAVANSATTLIGPLVSDAVVGDVSLLDQAHLEIGAGQTLTVAGSWSNRASFSSATDGTVVLTGSVTATNSLYGDTTFGDLRCETPGLTLNFQAGSSNAVTTSITLTGDENDDLTLRSTAPGTQWMLNVMATVASEDKTFRYLDVQDSDARPSASAISPLDSVNSGNNSNWIFAVVGQTNIWNGTASTAWGNGDNWSLERSPELFDARVTIPGGRPHYPILAGPVAITELTMDTGATLQLNGQTFTVNGAADIAGTLIAAASETVTFNSNLVFSAADAYAAAQSTLRLAAAGPQSFTPGGNTFHALDIANTNAVTVTDNFMARDLTFPATRATVTFQGGFAATNLSLVVSDGATLTFAAGETYTVHDYLWLRGALGQPVILTAAGTWHLEAGVFTSVRHVEVTDSDASGGQTIYAFDSIGHGSNPNWDFGNGKLWVGANTDWTAGANWSPSGAPGATAHVLIDGSASGIPRLTGAMTIGGLTAVGLAGPATLTVDMPFAGPDALTVDGQVNIGTNATLTHTAAHEIYRLALDVQGGLTVADGGRIDVAHKGSGNFQGDGAPSEHAGAGHGGQGGAGYNNIPMGGPSYGSVINPLRCGSGSKSRRGGGVILLTVDEALRLDGIITADGQPEPENTWTGGGAGGSINVTAASIAGDGTFSATGGRGGGNSGGGGGSGGRVAIVLTGAEANFDAFPPSAIDLRGGLGLDSRAQHGAAGTAYLQTAAEGAGRGTVVIDNADLTTTASTQLPPEISPTLDELGNAAVIVTNGGALAVTASDRIASLTIESDNEPLNLGPADTVLEVGQLTVHGTAYTKSGLYTAADWNGFATPAAVSGDGAILIKAGRTVITLW